MKSRIAIYLLQILFVITACNKKSDESVPVAASAKSISTFSFLKADNPQLSSDIAGSIAGDSVKLIVPFGTDLSNLVPSFNHTGKSVSPASGVRQNFSTPVTYTVRAEDGSEKNYRIITVTEENNGIVFFKTSRINNSGPGRLYALDANTGQLKWVFDSTTLDMTLSSMDYSDGTIYTGMGTYIVAFDPVTRTTKWRYPTGGTNATPCVVNGTVYANCNDMYLYAIDAITGNLKWRFAQGVPPGYISNYSSPTVVNGVVYFGSLDTSVYALNANTGAVIWRNNDPSLLGYSLYSSPLVVNGTLYIGSSSGGLVALDAATGTLNWVYPTSISVFSSPTYHNGTIYMGSRDNVMHAVDAVTGIRKWAYYATNEIYSSPVVENGLVYFGDYNGYLHAVNADSGTLKWTYIHGGWHFSSPVFFNNTVYIGKSANLVAVDAVTGVQKWTFNTPNIYEASGASPLVVDKAGRAYLPAIAGRKN